MADKDEDSKEEESRTRSKPDGAKEADKDEDSGEEEQSDEE